MKNNEPEKNRAKAAMEKRRVKMADGRRYLIFYTIKNDTASKTDELKSVESAARISNVEEGEIASV